MTCAIGSIIPIVQMEKLRLWVISAAGGRPMVIRASVGRQLGWLTLREQELRPSHCLAWVLLSLGPPLSGSPVPPRELRRVAGAVPARKHDGEKARGSEICLLRAWPKGGVISAQHLGHCLHSWQWLHQTKPAPDGRSVVGGRGTGPCLKGTGRSILETMTDRL